MVFGKLIGDSVCTELFPISGLKFFNVSTFDIYSPHFN